MSHSARPSFWWYLSIPIERVHSHSRELDAALAALTDSGAVSDVAVRNLAPQVELAPLFAT